MEIEKFIENYREAFGEAAGLPVVFWYSDEETGHTEKIGGCFFKGMQEVRAGNTISLNAEVGEESFIPDLLRCPNMFRVLCR